MRFILYVYVQHPRSRARAHTCWLSGSYIKESSELFWGQMVKMTSKRSAALHPSGHGCAILRTVAGPSTSPKTPNNHHRITVVTSVMLLALVQPASAHPQCLDFGPPFKPLWHLEFCAQYEQFGCCDQKTDNVIAERYWDIIDQLEIGGYDLCTDMLKEIMCQVCIFYYLKSIS